MRARVLLSFLSLAALAGLTSTAWALPAPSTLGPTGYILTPSAEVMLDRSVNAGYHALTLPAPPARLGGANPTVGAGTVNVGILDHVEVGYTRLQVHSGGTGGFNLGNAKVALLKPGSLVQVGGGVIDGWDNAFRTGYVVATANVGQRMAGKEGDSPLRSLQLGAGWATSRAGAPLRGAFVNGSVSPTRWAELQGEWISDSGMVNAGLRFRPFKGRLSGVALDVAATDITGATGSGWQPAGGISYLTFLPFR